jgi:hypothetical protein
MGMLKIPFVSTKISVNNVRVALIQVGKILA